MAAATGTSVQGAWAAAAKPSRAIKGMSSGRINPGGPTPLTTAARVTRAPSKAAHAVAYGPPPEIPATANAARPRLSAARSRRARAVSLRMAVGSRSSRSARAFCNRALAKFRLRSTDCNADQCRPSCSSTMKASPCLSSTMRASQRNTPVIFRAQPLSTSSAANSSACGRRETAMLRSPRAITGSQSHCWARLPPSATAMGARA